MKKSVFFFLLKSIYALLNLILSEPWSRFWQNIWVDDVEGFEKLYSVAMIFMYICLEFYGDSFDVVEISLAIVARIMSFEIIYIFFELWEKFVNVGNFAIVFCFKVLFVYINVSEYVRIS